MVSLVKRYVRASADYGPFRLWDLELISRRFLAWCVDYLLSCLFVNMVYDKLIHPPQFDTAYSYNLHQPLREALFLLYYAYCLGSKHCATFGMRLLKLKLHDETGARPSFRQCLVFYAINSIYGLWSRRFWFITIIGFGFTEAQIVHPQTVLCHVLLAVLMGGKGLSMVLLIMPLFFTSGTQSSANIYSRTRIICTQPTLTT